MPNTNRPLGLLIVAARQSLRQAISARARRYRLSTQQFWAMVSLRNHPGMTPGELGSLMLLDAPAASRLVALLVERGLVEARPDRDDRRRTHLFLSEAGELLGEKLGAIADEFHATVVRGLTAAELETLRHGLVAVAENLADFERGGRTATALPDPADGE